MSDTCALAQTAAALSSKKDTGNEVTRSKRNEPLRYISATARRLS